MPNDLSGRGLSHPSRHHVLNGGYGQWLHGADPWAERVGRLYPILVDQHGNIVDGRHRLAVDESWPKIRLEHVETEEQRLVARLISNTCRRRVAAEEKTEMLGRLGEIYLNEGVEAGKIAYNMIQVRSGKIFQKVK